MFLVLCSGFTFILIILPIWPRIVGIFLYINETQLHGTMPILTEYFVDEEKYFCLIVLHSGVAIYIAAMIMAAIGSTFVAYLKYVCGMFRIAR